MTDDWYKILQVHHSAESEVIEAAYKRLARKYHPDVNASSHATEMMQRLNDAYSVLNNPHMRAAYDDRCRERAGVVPEDKAPAPPDLAEPPRPSQPPIVLLNRALFLAVLAVAVVAAVIWFTRPLRWILRILRWIAR